jgi:NADH-quinone oxidoreductase subunit G
MLGLDGFDFETAEEVRAQALGDVGSLHERLGNVTKAVVAPGLGTAGALERVADVPIYSSDALVRRAPSLQATADARPPCAGLPSALWQQLGLSAGDAVRVSQGAGSVALPAYVDETLADGAVRVPAGHPATAALGQMFGPLTVEKA